MYSVLCSTFVVRVCVCCSSGLVFYYDYIFHSAEIRNGKVAVCYAFNRYNTNDSVFVFSVFLNAGESKM